MELEMKIPTVIGVLDLPNYSRGKQAECIRLNSWGDYPGEVILKVAGQDRGYTKEEAELLVEQTKIYQAELKVAGVKLPENLALFSERINDEYQIIMVDEFAGAYDCKSFMISNPTSESFDHIEKMVEFLHNLPSGEHPFKTAIMGDFKPDNWVMRGGKLVFVDYFAPKRFEGRNGVTPYLSKIDSLTPQAINFLCGDRRGQISRLVALISRDHPQLLDYTMGVIQTVYADMPKVLKFVQDEHERGFEKIDLVYKLTIKDMGTKI